MWQGSISPKDASPSARAANRISGGSEEGGIDEARQRQRCHMRQTRELAGSSEEF